MVSQREIAQKLNVSQTAVSLVLKNPNTTKVSADKRKKILDFINSIHYRKYKPDALSRIYFVSNSHLKYQKQLFLNGISAFAESYRISVEIRSLHYFLSGNKKRFDGSGIVLHGNFSRQEIVDLNNILPVCHLNPLPEPYLCDNVSGDSTQSMRLAIKYLVESGHKNIALWGLPQIIPAENLGYYLRKVNSFKINCQDILGTAKADNIVECQAQEYEQVLQFAVKYLKSNRKFTAFVAAGYFAARILYDAAIYCGKSLKIISCGYKDEADEASLPHLAYVSCDLEDMGKTAAAQLLKRANNPELPFVRLFCQPQLKG